MIDSALESATVALTAAALEAAEKNADQCAADLVTWTRTAKDLRIKLDCELRRLELVQIAIEQEAGQNELARAFNVLGMAADKSKPREMPTA